MSVILAVCGDNFCTFMSDGRQVMLDDNLGVGNIITDSFPKVCKLNDNIIYGTAGKFYGKESLISPFMEFDNVGDITLPLALRSIMNYISKRKSVLLPRTYFVGGKDNDGTFCFYTIRFVGEMFPYEPVLYKPVHGTFQIQIAAPSCSQSAEILQEYLYDKVPWGSHDNLCAHMRDVIRQISSNDISVGGVLYDVTVT